MHWSLTPSPLSTCFPHNSMLAEKPTAANWTPLVRGRHGLKRILLRRGQLVKTAMEEVTCGDSELTFQAFQQLWRQGRTRLNQPDCRCRCLRAMLVLALLWIGAPGAALATEAELERWIGRFYEELGISQIECPKDIVERVDSPTRLLCGETKLKFSKFQKKWQAAGNGFAGDGATVPSSPPSWQKRGNDYSRLYLCCGGGFEVNYMRDRMMLVTMYSDSPSWSPRPVNPVLPTEPHEQVQHDEEDNPLAQAEPHGKDKHSTIYIPGIGGVTDPVLKRKIKPKYPIEAERNQQEGQVILLGIIHSDGSVGDLTVFSSTAPGFGFEAAAIATVKRWRYKPSRLSGQPVPVYFTVEIDFSFPEARSPDSVRSKRKRPGAR